MDKSFKYDIAFSFLSEDESIGDDDPMRETVIS
jgi:hypothetical protein